jgi:hypothetical protein
MNGDAIVITASITTPIATQAELKKSVGVMIFTPGLCVRKYVAQLFTVVKYFLALIFTFVFMGDFSGLFGLWRGRQMGCKPSPYSAHNS